MWSEVQIKEYLKENLKESRFVHSLGVMDTAVDLAKKYGADENKARTAGLVHDCAKNMTDEQLLNIVEKTGYNIDYVSKSNPQLLHGLAGAYIAKNKMGIVDADVLSSIIYHTTGKENMSLLEKIIYVADYIEPSRKFDWVDDLRKAVYENLDKGLLLSFDNTIKYVILQNGLLHLNTIKARNYLLCCTK